MISCIICSRTPDISDELKQNIASTVGFEYELVVIDNSQNDYSIFSAYNEGVKRSKGDILCFMHDDILFKTQNWGPIMLRHFKDETIGLIGFAGTHFLPSVPAYWWSSPFKSQYNIDYGDEIEERFFLDFFKGNSLVNVVACDGLCFFIPKLLFNELIRFDDKTFHGFHFYDMDICMQILSQNYRVCVCCDVLVEHKWIWHIAGGQIAFNKARDTFFEKWKSRFPIHRGLPHMPDYVFARINYLYHDAYGAEKARKSKAYRLGNAILKPFKMIRGLFH
jgi:Glycosyl transferase family 2.